MKLGISSYTFTWACGVGGHPPPSPLCAGDLVRWAKDRGVAVIQLCENLAVGTAELKAIRDSGMEIEIGTRGLRGDHLSDAAVLAVECGSPFVRLVVDGEGHEPTVDETIILLRRALKKMPGGLKIALENHDRFPAAVLAEIVNAAGPERVGVTLDTVNSFGALEGPGVVVKTLAPFVLSLHVKDFVVRRVPSQLGFVIEGCPAGEGRLDLPWLLSEIAAAGRDPNAILELWTPFTGTLQETILLEAEWADKSIDNLRRQIPN